MKDRVIYHIDCNGFYAVVECLDRPELRDVPMAVAGDPKDRSGIILAKNELARKCGVKTAETIYQARRKCPDLHLVPPRHKRYAEVSRLVKALFGEYTDQVESFGLDEAWLDVTGSLRYFQSEPMELADRIRKRVREEIGVTVSIGVSFNKVFAKLGSDMKKPDATTLISRENYRQLVWPLPADALLFVGRTATEQLKRHAIHSIGDIARSDPAFLRQLLGKGGDTLWRYASGLDSTPVRRIGEEEPVKSIGNGMTFRRDLVGWDEIKSGVIVLTDEVASRLREAHLKCCVVQIVVKNPQLKIISRQMHLSTPTYLQKEIVDAAMTLLHANWRGDAPARAITVTAMELVDENQQQEQLTLLDLAGALSGPERGKLERVEAAMQHIRQKHGARSIAMGFVENEELGIYQFGAVDKQAPLPTAHEFSAADAKLGKESGKH